MTTETSTKRNPSVVFHIGSCSDEDSPSITHMPSDTCSIEDEDFEKAIDQVEKKLLELMLQKKLKCNKPLPSRPTILNVDFEGQTPQDQNQINVYPPSSSLRISSAAKTTLKAQRLCYNVDGRYPNNYPLPPSYFAPLTDKELQQLDDITGHHTSMTASTASKPKKFSLQKSATIASKTRIFNFLKNWKQWRQWKKWYSCLLLLHYNSSPKSRWVLWCKNSIRNVRSYTYVDHLVVFGFFTNVINFISRPPELLDYCPH